MATVTKIRRDCALVLRSRLDVTSPAFSASDEVRKALADRNVQSYLRSWVFPVIKQCAGYPAQWHGQREHISRDAARCHISLFSSGSTDPETRATIMEQLELYES